jgi:hypothetical protein
MRAENSVLYIAYGLLLLMTIASIFFVSKIVRLESATTQNGYTIENNCVCNPVYYILPNTTNNSIKPIVKISNLTANNTM